MLELLNCLMFGDDHAGHMTTVDIICECNFHIQCKVCVIGRALNFTSNVVIIA